MCKSFTPRARARVHALRARSAETLPDPILQATELGLLQADEGPRSEATATLLAGRPAYPPPRAAG